MLFMTDTNDFDSNSN